MDFLSSVNAGCTNYNSTNGFGCKFCLENGREWRNHCMKNKDGEYSCYVAYVEYVQKTIPDRLSSNTHTFMYSQLLLKKKM